MLYATAYFICTQTDSHSPVFLQSKHWIIATAIQSEQCQTPCLFCFQGCCIRSVFCLYWLCSRSRFPASSSGRAAVSVTLSTSPDRIACCTRRHRQYTRPPAALPGRERHETTLTGAVYRTAVFCAAPPFNRVRAVTHLPNCLTAWVQTDGGSAFQTVGAFFSCRSRCHKKKSSGQCSGGSHTVAAHDAITALQWPAHCLRPLHKADAPQQRQRQGVVRQSYFFSRQKSHAVVFSRLPVRCHNCYSITST